MVPIILDIETAPQDPEPFCIPNLEELEAPGNYKNPESIAKWKAEKAATLVDEIRERSSLEPLYGGIVVVVALARGITVVDGKPQTPPVATLVAPEPTEAGELELLTKLERGLAKYPTDPLVCWNGDFDWSFVARRALRHGLFSLASRMHRDRPWGNKLHIDLFEVWQQHERNARGKLKEVAQFLGLAVDPNEISGAEVAAALAAGDTAKVSAHCAADVERLRQIYWRMRAAGWVQGDDALPDELPVRPPRVSDREALLRACAELQISLDKVSVRSAAELAGIPWTGDPPGEDGPAIDGNVSVEQLKAFHGALRAKAAA